MDMDDLLKILTGTKFYALSSFFLPRLSCCIGVAYLYRQIVHPFLYYDHHLYLLSQDDSILSLVTFYLHHWLRTITIFLGFVTGCVIVWRMSLSIYRRCFQPAKAISKYGKWAIIAGFGLYLHFYFMNCTGYVLLLIQLNAYKKYN